MSSLFRATLAPLTAVGLLLASPVMAQTPAQDMTMPMMGMPAGQQDMMGQMMPMMGGGMMAMMHQHPEGYFAFLKTEIGITDAQNTVWTAYTDQLRPLIKKHQDAMLMMHSSEAKPRTWIEQLTDHEAMMSEHLETMKKIRPAATALYAALTPEQKKKADALMPGGMGMGAMHKRM